MTTLTPAAAVRHCNSVIQRSDERWIDSALSLRTGSGWLRLGYDSESALLDALGISARSWRGILRAGRIRRDLRAAGVRIPRSMSYGVLGWGRIAVDAVPDVAAAVAAGTPLRDALDAVALRGFADIDVAVPESDALGPQFDLLQRSLVALATQTTLADLRAASEFLTGAADVLALIATASIPPSEDSNA